MNVIWSTVDARRKGKSVFTNRRVVKCRYMLVKIAIVTQLMFCRPTCGDKTPNDISLKDRPAIIPPCIFASHLVKVNASIFQVSTVLIH